MFNLALFEPEIPPNTGNIIRLCANTGVQLHIIHPIGFEMDHKKLKRAGLDYHEFAQIIMHQNYDDFVSAIDTRRLFPCSTKGSMPYADARYEKGDTFLFGPETRGLPKTILDSVIPQQVLTIPMLPHNRSLNLANAAAVILYEAWRQHGFDGALNLRNL